MKKSKRSFTLLEISIALAILVLIASFTSINIKRLIDAHRFEKQVSDLFISLQEAQVLSATYQTDFCLDIEQSKGEFFFRFSTDEPFLEKKISQQKQVLSPGISIKFSNQPVVHQKITIYSGGRIEPSGILSFAQTKEKDSQVLYIDLQYGHLIKFCYSKPTVYKPLTVLSKPLKT